MVSKIEHRHRSTCPIANTLDIVGDHWSLLIIRNLMFEGNHEYKDMLAADEQISSSILTTRLKKLEEDGLITSVAHPDSKRRKLYYLTQKGKGLIHVMIHMVLWANEYLADRIFIPEDRMQLLRDEPDRFIKLTLDRIEAWEQQYL